MGFFEDVFSPQSKKPIVGIDLGSQYIKCAEIEIVPEGRPKILSMGMVRTPDGTINGANISKPEQVSEAILRLLENNQIDTKRVAFSLPSSAVFTKRINMPATAVQSLASNIYFEASNYIPHRMDAIHLDFQAISAEGANVEVLLVAIKNEIINSYRSLFEKSGLEPIIADVECFSLANTLELNLATDSKINAAIIDVGGKSTNITLLKKGVFQIAGDVPVGGKSYTDAIAEALQLTPEKAENAKLGLQGTGVDQVLVAEVMDRTNEYLCSEIQRQLNFLASGVGLEGGLQKIFLTGGSAKVPRLLDELSQKLSLPCEYFNAVGGFDLSDGIDKGFSSDQVSSMSVCLGLALRRSNDKPELSV